MDRPTRWRPTAFYWPVGGRTAFTNAAGLDDDGYPVRQISDPLDSSGILLAGSWVLESYDEKWGHARYRRPDGWGQDPPAFRLA